jgi:hypothetical protein
VPGGVLEWFPAPGKLNLFLHVLGRRADGMHELQTVFRLIDRCDRVGIARRDDGEISFPGRSGQTTCVSGRHGFSSSSQARIKARISSWKRTSRSVAEWGAAPRMRRRCCWC